jgi:methyltransferase
MLGGVRYLRRVSRFYAALVLVEAGFRLAELRLSARNERGSTAPRAAGSRYPLMVATHSALFVAPLVEVVLAHRRPGRLAPVWAGLLAAATGLRWWAIGSLGRSWNVRAAVPEDLQPITRGPYRFVRHPNYLAVILEFLALPMAGGAWVSAAALSAVHAAVLADRVRAEERLLDRVPGYRQALRGRARFIPGIF